MANPTLDNASHGEPAFEPMPAVLASRSRTRFVDCAVCQEDNSAYLFHRVGVRFVRCRSCGAVYVNPVHQVPTNYFDLDVVETKGPPKENDLAVADFDRLLQGIGAEFERTEGRPVARALLLGKYRNRYRLLPSAERMGLQIAEIDDLAMADLAFDGDLTWAQPLLSLKPEVVILHELLEACGDPGRVIARLIDTLPSDTWFVVTYTNVASLPAQLMRRHWPPFFDLKTTYFNTGHLTALFARFGLKATAQFPLPLTHSLAYLAERVAPAAKMTKFVSLSPLASVATPVRAGNRVIIFQRQPEQQRTAEKLSIIMPVFNEARYCERIIETVLAKPLPIDKELIIVESNSSDGSREIVRTFEGRPGVKVLYQDRPRGKGFAVRAGLEAATGTIILIQDADFEYDVEDYDALLQPILQHRAAFVLGSRSLGLDDWKVRRFGEDRFKGLILNAAQIGFARTFNLLYQQKVSDVNTMFKVFRAECLDGVDLEGDGFELDIELVCRLAKNGYSPMEVPVNYVARGFAEGKKIKFGRESVLSYLAFVRYRFKK